MSVFRVAKNKNYTVMSNHHLQDKNLSFKAKGLLSYMLSLPDDWDYSINGLVINSKEQKKAISSILKELEENKYLTRIKKQDEKGRIFYEYTIYEEPYTPKGCTVEGCTLKEAQQSTNIQNTNYKDKLDKINYFTKILIESNYITIYDTSLFKYDEVLTYLSENHEISDLMITISYFLSKVKKKENPINNKFAYFKTSINENLYKINNTNNVPDWFDLKEENE